MHGEIERVRSTLLVGLSLSVGLMLCAALPLVRGVWRRRQRPGGFEVKSS
jgi:hypothetical protein